jgi:hypothetical protein
VDVVLAEYNAIRAEILSRSSAQHILINLDLTLTGVITGIAFSQRISMLVLLLIPILSACCALLYFDHAKQIDALGAYISRDIALKLDTLTGTDGSLGWDRVYSAQERGFRVVLLSYIVPTFVLFILNPLVLLISMLWARDFQVSDWAPVAWWLGIILELLVATSWILLIHRWSRLEKPFTKTK